MKNIMCFKYLLLWVHKNRIGLGIIYAIATVIVEDLQIMNHIDLNIDVNNSGLYNDLIDYFYETLKDRTKKLYKHLTEFDWKTIWTYKNK